MRKNLAHDLIKSMYYSLSREAHNFWGYDRNHVLPPFRILPLYATILGGSTEDKNDSFALDRPGPAIALTTFRRADLSPVHVVLSDAHIPYMYEDEVIVTLLHEIAHVHVGPLVDHGPEWQAAAEEVGSFPEPVFITRAAWDLEIPWYTAEEGTAIRQVYSEPSLGFI